MKIINEKNSDFNIQYGVVLAERASTLTKGTPGRHMETLNVIGRTY